MISTELSIMPVGFTSAYGIGRYKTQVTGHRSQVTGYRSQVTGYRSQVTENATKS